MSFAKVCIVSGYYNLEGENTKFVNNTSDMEIIQLHPRSISQGTVLELAIKTL